MDICECDRADIKVSICASANRIKWWPRFLDSLRQNKIAYEVVFAGDVKPDFDMSQYPEFRYIHATVKPAQAYEIAFRAARGELVHWSADDADYNARELERHLGVQCPNSIDLAYQHYKECEAKYGDKKTIIAMRPIEDGGDVYDFHHFFGGWHHTPVMAPFGLLNRNWFISTLGGYDRNFVSGQSENDVVMRGIEDGGRVELCLDCFLYVHHRQVHPRNAVTGKEENKFRKHYGTDREYLERCWVVGGYGHYEADKKDAVISPTRLCSVDKFDDKDICTETQGPRGIW